ncbi:uncharacterized protein C9orf57 homolog [Cricetulus griseus]|uniref:Uncharacterized protein C9orf57 homolog n=2 Tax=Cricetulus griseus TaxID=10029 RepID=A0A9J7GSJ0_CRIGR|nr:uncharacterized protein C9orf57 homolog [Cricetulus griseus]XP_035317848.1 uncharacterized protein C9orf57 homolog [Cricetulus griseus]
MAASEDPILPPELCVSPRAAVSEEETASVNSAWKRCVSRKRSTDLLVPTLLSLDAGGSSGVGGVICRSCNLSIPFHGCLLDLGTCRTKPGQFCIRETFTKGGIQWFSVKGCTEDKSECFKRIMKNYEIRSSHCCHRPLCNF